MAHRDRLHPWINTALALVLLALFGALVTGQLDGCDRRPEPAAVPPP